TSVRGVSTDGKKLLLLREPDDRTEEDREDQLWLFNIYTGKTGPRITLSRHRGGRAILSPSGRCIAVAEEKGPIRFLDAATGEELGRLKGSEGCGPAVFAPDGKTLFGGSGDSGMLVWDLSDIPLPEPESDAINYLWWIAAAGLVLLALAVLWKIVSFFQG